MNKDNRTLEYYNNFSDEFIEGTLNADMSFFREKFINYLSPSSLIMDAGCGSGRDSKEFLRLGYKVKAIDASEKMCQFASEYIGQPVECKLFEDISDENMYDAIWACASLLHVRKDNTYEVLQRLNAALKPDGILYISYKYGKSESFRNNRWFNYYTEEELFPILNNSGFEILEMFITDDVRKNRQGEKWINIFARKCC